MFELVYWCGIDNEQGEFITEIVEIDKRHLLTFDIGKFLKFINESGQVNLIPIDNINRLKELD